ncbi:ribonuclease H-like domain-containing protein [Tanacetum coccineum]|uniref:Ribonuclease H-like domain-containing protein n=1 Tax=Tanacetum coccineum TaxID=301880 RepID=A0ABQ4X1H3_9ASTR
MSHISPLPKSPSIALSDPNWYASMYDEYNALVKNSTWMLVLKPPNPNVVRSMWLFRHKYHVDGSLSSMVVKPATIRTVLGLALSHGWPVHKLDVKNAFLKGDQRRHLVLGFNGLLVMLYVLASLLSCKWMEYLTFTRPDISYAVQHVCLHMHDPREPHLVALKRVLRYVGCPTTRRSTSGYCVFLGDNLLSWSAKQQHTLSRSSAEAEYRGVANVVVETTWLRNLLRELHTPLLSDTLVYCDNVRVLHVPSRYQYADIFTKGLPSVLFEEFRTSLSGLEVGSIRRIQGIGYGVLEFLLVGTTFDIFQNIHILYIQYGVLVFSGYGVLSLFPLWSLIRPMLYDGSVIAKETNVISIVDSEETLMLEEESQSKMILKQRVSRSTKSSRSKSTDNTKNDRILQISSSTQKKNKVEAHSRIVKSCLNKPNCVVKPAGNANVQHSKLNTNSELMCVKCNSSMFDARHELCFLEFVSDMNASSKSKSVKKAKKKEE